MRRRSNVTIVLLAALVTGTPVGTAAAQSGKACCTITALDARSGIVTAQQTSSGSSFEFTLRNRLIIPRLRVGQAVFANFERNQVSLDGRTVCCTITRPPGQAEAATQQSGARTPAGGGRTEVGDVVRGAGMPGRGSAGGGAGAHRPPTITFGEPVPVAKSGSPSGKLGRLEARTIVARVDGRTLRAQMLLVNGRQGIESANLPDGVKRLMALHVRTLPMHASQLYLVNPESVAEWAKTHPVPANIQPPEEKDSDCGEVSINGLVDCGEDAGQAVKDEYERARRRAQKKWDESMDWLTQSWKETRECVQEQVLRPRVPVSFQAEPKIPLSWSQSSSRDGASGSISGSVTLSVPVASKFDAGVDFFYIPCMPFLLRPRSVSASGTLTLSPTIDAEVAAAGSFEKRFRIPPTGQPEIPLYVIPIVIGDVPVAELHVSAFLEGDLKLKAEGKASGSLSLSTSQTSEFGFECGGERCDGSETSTRQPVTSRQSAKIEGRVTVEPGLYAGLQLSFNYNALQARAGLQPYLTAMATGCAAVKSTQMPGSSPQGGGASMSTSAALMAELDWSVALRAEALAGGQRVGKEWTKRIMPVEHLWDRDLAPGGSSALVPEVMVPAQAAASQPALINVRMPICFPYKHAVHYRVTWSGDARPAASGACRWNEKEKTGRCQFAPSGLLSIRLTWRDAGSQTVTVQLMGDDHERDYQPAPPPAQVSIKVAGGAQ